MAFGRHKFGQLLERLLRSIFLHARYVFKCQERTLTAPLDLQLKYSTARRTTEEPRADSDSTDWWGCERRIDQHQTQHTQIIVARSPYNTATLWFMRELWELLLPVTAPESHGENNRRAMSHNHNRVRFRVKSEERNCKVCAETTRETSCEERSRGDRNFPSKLLIRRQILTTKAEPQVRMQVKQKIEQKQTWTKPTVTTIRMAYVEVNYEYNVLRVIYTKSTIIR